MNNIIENIIEIGGAKIIEYLILDEQNIPTNRTKHIIAGSIRNDFYGLAICQYDGENGYYLFYCDDKWNEISDIYKDTIEDAKEQANYEYLGLENKWIKK